MTSPEENAGEDEAVSVAETPPATQAEFCERFAHHLATCPWRPHPQYSVFTQYDQAHYLRLRDPFLIKYFSFWALSRTIRPRKIIELGTSAGSGADAYMSGSPEAEYLGVDLFGVAPRHDDGALWDPYEIAQKLFTARGFQRWRLLRADLRALESLPETADLVVVDAAHDYANEYADLRLALTADPEWIFVDDADDPGNAKPAVENFVRELEAEGRVDFTVPIPYIGGGFVIRLKGSGGQSSEDSGPGAGRDSSHAR